MKKTLKIAGIVIGAFLLLLIVLPFAFRGKVETLIKQEGNKMLNAQFDFSTLDISLISNFPKASLTLEDFWLKGVGEFENDTLVKAKELTATVDVLSLFGDEGFDISTILVDRTSIRAIVLEDGRPNWDVMKPSDEVEETASDTTSAPFRIKLRQLEVKDMNLIYDDRQAGMYAEMKKFDATLSGDFASDESLLHLQAETPLLTYAMGGIAFLNEAAIQADMDIQADFANNRYTLNKNTLRLNAIQAGIDGWVALTPDGNMDMDMKLNTNEVGFKEVLSLIPAIYAKDFEGLKTDGKATLNAYAQGPMVGDSILPRFEVMLDVKDAMFRYPSLPAGVNGINISALVKNEGGSADATTILVNPFNFVMAGNPFSITAEVSNPMTDLAFNASARGKLDLGKVKDVYPLEDMTLNGLVDADMTLNGRMSYIEKEQYDKVQASGNIRLSDMKLQMKDIPDVDIQKSTFTFNPRYLQLSETTVRLGENDLTLDSRFENYMAFALKGSTLKGTLNLQSNRLNLNDFMTTDTTAVATTDTTSMGIIRIPDNIDFQMQANMKEVLFDGMKFANLKGQLIVKNQQVNMKNLALNTMGGSVTVNGAYATPDKAPASLNAGFAMKDITFADAYRELDMVKQLAPIFEGLKGSFSGQMNIDTQLDEQMSPVIPTMQGSGKLSTSDLNLSGVKVIDQVADIVKKPGLKDINVKNLTIDFTIKDGRVNTKPFDLKLGEYAMNLSGSTGLDQTIDYVGKITIPQSVGKLSKLGTVDMTIGGSFTSPKVGIDMEGLAKQAAKQAVEDLGSKLLGIQKDTTATDSAKTKPTKQEVAGKVLNKALDLFKKKK